MLSDDSLIKVDFTVVVLCSSGSVVCQPYRSSIAIDETQRKYTVFYESIGAFRRKAKYKHEKSPNICLLYRKE